MTNEPTPEPKPLDAERLSGIARLLPFESCWQVRKLWADELLQHIAAQAAELAALRKDDDWQPIETAPKKDGWDSPKFRLWIPGRGEEVGRWDDESYSKKPRPFWNWNSHLGKRHTHENQPTHWRPLAKGPALAPTQAQGDETRG